MHYCLSLYHSLHFKWSSLIKCIFWIARRLVKRLKFLNCHVIQWKMNSNRVILHLFGVKYLPLHWLHSETDGNYFLFFRSFKQGTLLSKRMTLANATNGLRNEAERDTEMSMVNAWERDSLRMALVQEKAEQKIRKRKW